MSDTRELLRCAYVALDGKEEWLAEIEAALTATGVTLRRDDGKLVALLPVQMGTTTPHPTTGESIPATFLVIPARPGAASPPAGPERPDEPPDDHLHQAWPWGVYTTACGNRIRHEITGTELDLYAAAKKLNAYHSAWCVPAAGPAGGPDKRERRLDFETLDYICRKYLGGHAKEDALNAIQRLRAVVPDAPACQTPKQELPMTGWSEHPDAHELLEQAWGIIANVSGGDWSKQEAIWQSAAAHWRDRWIAFPGRHEAAVARTGAARPPQGTEDGHG